MEATFCKKPGFRVVVMALALMVGSGVAWAQTLPTAAPVVPPSDAVYQVTYFANARQALDGKVRIMNDGTLSGFDPAGRICVNFYVLSNEDLSECCACELTPDGGRELSINNDLTSNPGSGPALKKGVIKLLATVPSSGTCNPSAPTSSNLVRGLRAWVTHVQAVLPNLSFPVTEEEFQNGELSANELAHLTGFCAFIQANDSGKGICSCGSAF
jgi:hypothetical protein